jgi:hypothetical protein
LAWRDAQAALECAAKYLRRSKAAGNRYFLKTHRCRFNLTARSFKAEVFDVSRRRPAHLLLKQASKVPGTHSCALGETFNGKIARMLSGSHASKSLRGDFAEIWAMRVALNCD